MNLLSKLRKEHELTQLDLANVISVSDKTIGAWERGTRTPKTPEMQKLEDYFHIRKELIFPDAFSYYK